MKSSNRLLRRFWFQQEAESGYGVTAYSRDDAATLLMQAGYEIDLMTVQVTEDVDVSSLDQNHILPNIGPSNFRGVWYPNLNISSEP